MRIAPGVRDEVGPRFRPLGSDPGIITAQGCLTMKRLYTFFWVTSLAFVVPPIAEAHPPSVFPPGTFGTGPNWLGLFPHIHQHGPLYNYGPYYGYPPFEPYGPWTANLQYNPAYSGVYAHFGRTAEDKSGHGGLFTSGNGGGIGLGSGLGLGFGGRWGQGNTSFFGGASCSQGVGFQGFGLLKHRNITPGCSACNASPIQGKPVGNGGAPSSAPAR